MTRGPIIRILHLFSRCLLLVIFVNASDFNQSCVSVDDIELPAYANWPFRVDCAHLESFWKTGLNATTGDEFQCIVTHNGNETSEGIFELSSENNDKLYKTQLVVNGTQCLTGDVVINLLQPIPEGECQAVVNDAFERDEIERLQTTIGSHVTLRCIPPKGTPTLIPEGVNRDDFHTYWYTTCKQEEYRTNNLWKTRSDPDGYPDMLNMPLVDFYDATNFTCTVKYRERILFPFTYAQCIKQAVGNTDPTVTCPKSNIEPKGGVARLNCGGQLVVGITPSEDFLVEWKKGSDIICRNSVFNRSSPGLFNDRIRCIVKGNNDSVACVADGGNIPEEDIQRPRKKLALWLNISNLESPDFGEYSVVIKYKQHKGSWMDDVSQNIALNEDLTPFYEELVIGFTSALVVLCIFILAGFLIYHFRIYILIAYKRSRLTKYDRDDKQWVAYLSYYYDGDTLEEQKGSESTKIIVSGVHKVMETLGYTYYDEQRQGDFAVVVERITNIVEQCHRMILVLTPQYLDDKWRRFHAELGFHGLLESRIGLVVILTPGVKKLLEKRAETDAVWRRLLIALKTNRVINWKETMSKETLMNHIEYALPKLPQPGKRRASSGNEPFLVGNGLQIPEYLRSASQATTTTTISPDTPAAEMNVFM